MTRYALVLGGGGVTGIAWETGVLHGLREQGVDLTDADLIVGTSAGSVVGAQLATGLTPSTLYARQTTPPDPAIERAPTVDLSALMRAFADRPPTTGPLRPEVCAQIGQLALGARSEPEESRLAAISTRLPIQEWSERRLLITAIDAADGRFVVWDNDSDVPLLLAVASSCAVPMIYPPITIGGRRYIDGGIRSGTNADLAADYPLVIVIAPMAGTPATQAVLDAEAAGLRAGGSQVEIISPDAAARTAIGQNPLDPARRVASAEAGRAQADAHVGRVRAALAER